MSKAPCLGCPDRHIGCHGECERYKAFAAECSKARAERLEQRIASGYTADKIRKAQKNPKLTIVEYWSQDRKKQK